MKTMIQKKEEVKREKHEIDASDRVLGRLAREIAELLSGKNKIDYTPHVDTGDFVEISNLEKLHIPHKKLKKKYYKHSGYPQGLKEKTLRQIWENDPQKVFIKAVRGMLPDNRLREERLKRLTFKNTNV